MTFSPAQERCECVYIDRSKLLYGEEGSYRNNSQLTTMNEERTVHDSSGPESPRARPTKNKRRPRFIRKVICQVCGDDANDHEHYGGVACYACKVVPN